MEVGQVIISAIKKPKKRGTRSKKKRLTFEDEINVTKSEEDVTSKSSEQIITAKSTNFLAFGFILIKSFSQKGSDIVGATYNSWSKRLVLADGKGFFSLDLRSSNCNVRRELTFEKYQFSMARIIIYAEKFNVYFVLQKDYVIKVHNKDYTEICSVENAGSGRLTFISFNPMRDELISGGINGVKTWKFKEKKIPTHANPVPMYNYSLFPSTEYPYMGKKWCTNMDFDVIMQRYYCFSEGHFFCYDINGKLLLEILNAHQTAILSCIYSSDVKILLTSSRGSEIKSWNDQGCLLHIFQGHSKTVTKLLLHPNTASLFISGSLDGSIKLWSFDTMDIFYSLSPFQEGILWIGTVEDKYLYCCSARSLHIFNLNTFTSFWTRVNSPISDMYVCGADGKSNRVIAMGTDNSLRIYSLHSGTRLCTVLPPPYPPLIQPIIHFTYNQASGTIYFLLTPWDIWVYTARTDPACRTAVWTIGELQQHLYRKHPLASCVQKNEYFQHTRRRNFRTPAKCECLCSLSSPLCYLTDEGMVYADSQEFLVLGMQDGRVLFLHTSIQNLVYYELIAYRDPVIHLKHDVVHQELIIMYQRSKSKLIHFRSLPALELVFQAEVSNDTLVFTRLNRSLFVGLASGTVDILNILNADEEAAFSEKKLNNSGQSERIFASSCSEDCHNGPVVAVDSCKDLSVFLSCGSDSMVKLWDMQKNLLAEITLDNTLTTACFLNSCGDILLAFKSDLYFLSHSKALGIMKPIDTATISAAESYIFESQPTEDEEKYDVPKSIELASYLEPYKGYAFTDDFTSELHVLPKKKEKQSWRLAIAPSEVYCSPSTSEASLKMFDFLLHPGIPDLEKQDKAEMSERMIVTEGRKYVPGPMYVPSAKWEMPFFGVSPCSSQVPEQFGTRTQSQEQNAEAESDVSTVEPLQETQIEKQHPISEETSPEVPEVIPESVCSLDRLPALEPITDTDSNICGKIEEKHSGGERQFRSVKFGSWQSPHRARSKPLDVVEVQETKTKHVPKEHVHKKLFKTEKLVLKKIRTPKHAKHFSVSKSAVRSRDTMYIPYSRASHSVVSVGGKLFPGLETKASTSVGKRPLSGKKTDQQQNEDYESPYEKDIIRVVAWRRKQNERIRQAEERRLLLELRKRPCSRNHCFTPTNSQQYQNLQSSENLSETLFTLMKPWMKQHHSRPYTVMEETIVNLPRDFPYRRYILMNDPVSAPSTPALSPLESKLLSVRFPKQKEKILCSLISKVSTGQQVSDGAISHLFSHFPPKL
nr:uncharacterized protein C3orf22 homolog isoform X3 [Pogona vitticeps]